MNRDVELLKVKVLADYVHNLFCFQSSIQVSAFVGIYVGSVLLRIQETITDITFILALIVLFVVFIFGFVLFPLRDYHANLDKMDDLLIRFEKGESLPSLKKLRK